MTASGATNMNIYPQEDDEKNPVSIYPIALGTWLTVFSI